MDNLPVHEANIFGWIIGWFISAVLSYFLRPKPPKPADAKRSSLSDFDFPTATEGRSVPLIWGTVRISGPNVVWYGDLEQTPRTQQGTVIGYLNYLGIQMVLCHGDGCILKRIRVGEKELWTGTATGETCFPVEKLELFGGITAGAGGVNGTVCFYEGNGTQNPNEYLTTFQSEGGDTPAYRHFCYVVLQHMYLGTSTYIRPWDFEVQRIPDGLGLGVKATVNGNDANPANVVYEILTNQVWGAGGNIGDIDTTNFTEIANTLYDEGNGFSYILDNATTIDGMFEEIERQIDGVIYIDRESGKWKINLVRDDYDINTITEINDSNTKEVIHFTRGSWQETTNEFKVLFSHRDNEYNESYAVAQDMANQQIQQRTVTVTQQYNGVKDKDLANSLAWRDLTHLCRPIVKARVIVDRTFWNVQQGDILSWTNDTLGFTKLPVRVLQADLGQVDDGQIEMEIVEDVFSARIGSFASPPETQWEDTVYPVVNIPSYDRIFMEAPKGIADRDIVYPGVYNRVWGGARAQGDGYLTLNLYESSSLVGILGGYMLAGSLVTGVDISDNGIDIEITGNPDTYSDLYANTFDTNDSEIAQNLSNLVVINNEFLSFRTVTDLGDKIRLDNVVRGMLDSVPASHTGNSRVWLVGNGGGLTDVSFATSPVSIYPLPQSFSEALPLASGTATSVTLSSRHLRPLPGARMNIAGSVFNSNVVSLDSSVGASDDGAGVAVSWVRRDYRETDALNTITDEVLLPADFPSANNTIYKMSIYNNPTGSNSHLYTVDYFNGNSSTISRTKILRYTAGVIPSYISTRVGTKHTVSSVDYTGIQDLRHDFHCSSAYLSGGNNMGILNQGTIATAYASAPESGDYSVTIGHQVIATDKYLHARINGGSWFNVISSGNTSGLVTGLVPGNSLQFRHHETGADTDETLLVVVPPTSPIKAYGVMVI